MCKVLHASLASLTKMKFIVYFCRKLKTFHILKMFLYSLNVGEGGREGGNFVKRNKRI